MTSWAGSTWVLATDGVVVLVLRLILQAVGYGRAFILGLQNPVAVPLNLTVVEQAAIEAATLQKDN